MEPIRTIPEGSALILCMLCITALTTMLVSMHIRLHFFAQTVYEREQMLKLEYATQALMGCAIDMACNNFSAWCARKQYEEQLDWPIDSKAKAKGRIMFQQQDTMHGCRLQITVAVTVGKRTYTLNAAIQREYDAMKHTVIGYQIHDWHR
jgi:hypothetical protein